MGLKQFLFSTLLEKIIYLSWIVSRAREEWSAVVHMGVRIWIVFSFKWIETTNYSIRMYTVYYMFFQKLEDFRFLDAKICHDIKSGRF